MIGGQEMTKFGGFLIFGGNIGGGRVREGEGEGQEVALMGRGDLL